jgi:type II secretory ATPase GspE/PulE/Tfp pilus assembly ATPase PilB-like protein
LIPNEIQSINELGMPSIVTSFADFPRGLVLVTGPTGSGKSTTLAALVDKINREKTAHIITIEDPIEFTHKSIRSVVVQREVHYDTYSFSAALRSALREDPDVVLIGEMRDLETISAAITIAETGHLVFATLHTNSAAGIMPRLLDMGIEPFLIASTLNTVIGQRLVRRVAERRETYQSSEMETNMIKGVVGGLLPQSQGEVPEVSEKRGYGSLPVANSKSFTLVKGIASEEAPNGYKGRAGLYETISVDDDIQKLIVARATSGDIMRVAKMKGAITMRQDGMLKALTGMTTIEEVNRVASDLA